MTLLSNSHILLEELGASTLQVADLLDLELTGFLLIVASHYCSVTCCNSLVGILLSWQAAIFFDDLAQKLADRLTVLLYLHFKPTVNLYHKKFLKELFYELSTHLMI